MKYTYVLRKAGVSLTSLSLVFGLSFSSISFASAQIAYSPQYVSAGDENVAQVLASYGIDYEESKEKLENDFEFLFTEVVVQDSMGKWFIKDPGSSALMDFSNQEISIFIDMLNAPDFRQESLPSSLYSLQKSANPSAIIKDWNKYTLCVIEGAAGFKIPPSLAIQTVFLAKQGRWNDVATTVLRGLAESAASGLLDSATTIAFKQLSNSVPGVFAARLVVNASLCVMYNQ